MRTLFFLASLLFFGSFTAMSSVADVPKVSLALASQDTHFNQAPAVSKTKKTWKVRVLERMMQKKIKKTSRRRDELHPTHHINIASLGFGILSWISLAANTGGIFILASIAAIVLGIIGISRSGSNKERGGQGLGIAGLSIGIFNIIVIGLVFIILSAAFGG